MPAASSQMSANAQHPRSFLETMVFCVFGYGLRQTSRVCSESVGESSYERRDIRKGLVIQKETTRLTVRRELFQREDATEEAAAPVCRKGKENQDGQRLRDGRVSEDPKGEASPKRKKERRWREGKKGVRTSTLCSVSTVAWLAGGGN